MFDILGLFASKKDKPQSFIDKTRQDADNDGLAFGNKLDKYLASEVCKPRRVLDICAGIAPEEAELCRHFGIQPGQLITVEKDPQLVKFAQEIGRKTIVAGDLNDHNFTNSLPTDFDLVIGRNVPLAPGNSPEPDSKWVNIFRNIGQLMTDQGTIMITLLTENELAAAGQLLPKAGFTIDFWEKSDSPTPSNVTGVSALYKDNFILVAKKTPVAAPEV